MKGFKQQTNSVVEDKRTTVTDQVVITSQATNERTTQEGNGFDLLTRHGEMTRDVCIQETADLVT
jgi:hypothetical protein